MHNLTYMYLNFKYQSIFKKSHHVFKVCLFLHFLQELEFVKVTRRERLREASEVKKGLRREIERIKDEHSDRMRDLVEERDRLRRELQAASNPDVSKVCSI